MECFCLDTKHWPNACKNNCRKADLYIYIGEKSKDLVMGSKFLDCVTVFTYILKSAKLWDLIPKFLIEGYSTTPKKKKQKKQKNPTTSHFIHKAIISICPASWFKHQQSSWL